MGTALCGTARAVGPGVATAYIECRGCRHRRPAVRTRRGRDRCVRGHRGAVLRAPAAPHPRGGPDPGDPCRRRRRPGGAALQRDRRRRRRRGRQDLPLRHLLRPGQGRELAHAELRHLARQVRRDGVIRESELDLARGPVGRGRVTMHARVAPLGSSHVLLLLDDTTHPAGWRRSAATSSPTSATSSRHPSVAWRCWPRQCSTPATTRRPSRGSPGACRSSPPGWASSSRRSSSCRGSRWPTP